MTHSDLQKQMNDTVFLWGKKKLTELFAVGFILCATSLQILRKAIGYLFPSNSSDHKLELMNFLKSDLEYLFLIGISIWWVISVGMFKWAQMFFTRLPIYFRRKINHISVLFQFLPKHLHIQFFIVRASWLPFCLSFMLHEMDIHAPYSKVTSNDFNFQNEYSTIYNLTQTILMKKLRMLSWSWWLLNNRVILISTDKEQSSAH